MSGHTAAENESAFDLMAAEWLTLRETEAADIGGWERALAQMSADEHFLRSKGRWRSGGQTLLYALGLHRSEVPLCAALAWVLRPDGWHGLGDRFLRGFLSHTSDDGEVPAGELSEATVVVEETRGDTRADVIIRWPGHCVLIEAKVLAGEQPMQCDRLARHWGDEEPVLVFLTRDGGTPLTAVESRGRWLSLTWVTIAALLREASEGQSDAAPGVGELIETLTRYGAPTHGR